MDILDEVGEFFKIGPLKYFVETKSGNFIWDEVAGSLTYCEDAYYTYLYKHRIISSKYRGKRKVRDFCGEAIVIKKLL